MTEPKDERSESPKTPDPVPPGDASEVTPEKGPPPGAESRERELAWKRGELLAKKKAERGADSPEAFPDPGPIAQLAFTALAENVRDYAIFLMNPEGYVVYWGEGARLIKWWTNDQAVGAHFRFLYLDGGSEDGTAEGHLDQVARRGEMTSEGQRVRSDGSTFWAGATLTALRGADGQLHGFAKVTRDLTASHAAEAFLKGARDAAEASRKLEAANRAKGEFLNTMSHELRTPLQAIIAYTELLHMEIAGPLNQTQREQLERI